MNRIATKWKTIVMLPLLLLAWSCSERESRDEHEKEEKPDYVTDIWIVDLERSEGRLIAGDPRNITHRPGYDNQPKFVQDGSALLYSSGVANEEPRTDVYRYDFDSGEKRRLTTTDEPEFSPYPIPGGLGYSVVRAEDDGTSRLWVLDDQSDASEVIFPETVDVAYYNWIDSNRIAMMTEGKEAMTLQIGYVSYGEARPVDEFKFASRTLQVRPGTNQLTFMREDAEGESELVLMDLDDFEITHLARPPEKSWEFVWTHDGHLLMGEGTALYCLDGDTWSLVRDFGDILPGPITRLAISPDDGTLAMVVWEHPIDELK